MSAQVALLTVALRWHILLLCEIDDWLIADYRHLGRELGSVPVETIEISASQMVLVMKLTTFAWNVHDGRQSSEVGSHFDLLTTLQTLDDSQKATRLTKLPNPLAYLAYWLVLTKINR